MSIVHSRDIAPSGIYILFHRHRYFKEDKANNISFVWGEQAGKRIAGRLWLENFEVLQFLESVKNTSCRQAGEHKIGVVLQRRGQVGATLDELWGDYKNKLGAGDRTAVAWEHWSE